MSRFAFSSRRISRQVVAYFGRGGLALAALLMVFIIVLVRVAPLGGPMVFSDEYSYAALSAAFWIGGSPSPLVPLLENWLFISAYSITHVAHADPVELARLLNAFVAAIGVLPLLWLVKFQSDARISVIAVIAFSAFFVGGMAAYFKPEVLYYVLVIASICSLVAYSTQRSTGAVMGVAVALGAAALTKSHAVLLVPGFIIVMVLCNWPRSLDSWTKTLIHIVVFVCLFLLIVSGTKSIFAGTWSLNPLGSFYSGIGGGVAGGKFPTEQLLFVAGQHMAILGIVAGPYLVFASWAGIRFLSDVRAGRENPLAAGSFVAIGSLVGMLLVTVLFSVAVASHGGYESINRMHGRYYEHLAWLAALFGVLVLPMLCDGTGFLKRAIVAVLALSAVWGGYLLLSPLGWQNPNDFSSVFAMSRLSDGPLVAASLSSLAAIGLLVPWKNLRVALVAFAFVAWLTLNTWVIESLRWTLQPSAVDIVGQTLSSLESNDPAESRIKIVSPGHTADVFRLAYWLKDEHLDVLIMTPGMDACIPIPSEVNWIAMLHTSGTPCNATKYLEIHAVVLWRKN